MSDACSASPYSASPYSPPVCWKYLPPASISPPRGDWLGDGEPLWLIGPDWKRVDGDGFVGSCFPLAAGAICQAGSYGEGRIFPRTRSGQFLAWTFAEENFDGFSYEFHLFVEAHEWDFIPVVGAVADFLQESRPRPRGLPLLSASGHQPLDAAAGCGVGIDDRLPGCQ